MSANLYRRRRRDGKLAPTWWGRVEVAGREHRRSLRTRDRDTAARRLEAWRKELIGEAYFGERRLLWEEAVLRYTEEVMPGAVKPSTATRYLVSFRQVRSFLDGRYIDTIGRKVLLEIVAGRKKAGVGNATINRDLTAISAVLGAATAWDAIEVNPVLSLERRRLTREKRDPIALPEHADVERFAAACPPMLGRMVLLLWQTGLRLEEAASLQWRQVDLHRRVITLSRTKRNNGLAVPLSEAAVGTLAGTPRRLKCGWVFWHVEPGGEASRYRNVSLRLREIRRDAKPPIPFRTHDLRHLFAVDWLKGGGSIYDLQQALRHASIKTTELYLAFLTAEEQRVVKRVTSGGA